MLDVKYPDVTVQLSGEDGNALAMISRVRRALKKGGAKAEAIARFSAEATSGDYDNVIATCGRWVNVE
jgi:hypothetical protein